MSTTSGQASTMGDQTSFESTTSDKTVSTTIVTLINVFFLKKISENHYLWWLNLLAPLVKVS